MSIRTVRGKYLIEKSRRQMIGVIARVGTGGSVPRPVQEVLNAYVESLAAGTSGANAKELIAGEREQIRNAMKQMQHTWLILSPAGLRWTTKGDTSLDAIKKALKNSGWKVGAEDLRALCGDPK